MAKTNLSLGGLYRAVTGVYASNSALSYAGSGNNRSMSAVAVDSITITMPFTYIMEETYENVAFSFGSAGANFGSYIQNKDFNYDVNVNVTTFFSAPSHADTVNSPGTWRVTAKLNTTGGYGGSTATTLSAKFADGYNINATNYNTATTKDIYSVDTYNQINNDVMCVSVDSQILMQDGSLVDAADLYVGDVIKTYVPTDMPEWLPANDPENWYWWYQTNPSGEIVDATIGNIYYSFTDSYVSINDGMLKVTKSHPLYTFDTDTETYQFAKAEDVFVGDKLVKYNHESGQLEDIIVTKVDIIDETLEIATITVDVAQTYLANGFVSHNKGTATAPIPWQNLTCYLDAERTQSYFAQNQAVWNDITGNATGFNVVGAGVYSFPAPTFNNTTPKFLVFSAAQSGFKLLANDSGTNNNRFNTTAAAGFTIFAFITKANTMGYHSILKKGSDWEFYLQQGCFVFAQNGDRNGQYQGSATHALGCDASFGAGWSSVAMVYRGSSVDFYHNGAFVQTVTTNVSNQDWSTTRDMILAYDSTAIANYANMLFYQRKLSTAEIGQIHNNMKGRFGL